MKKRKHCATGGEIKRQYLALGDEVVDASTTDGTTPTTPKPGLAFKNADVGTGIAVGGTMAGGLVDAIEGDNKTIGGQFASGALKGAAAGAALGPWGAAAGAAIGGTTAAIKQAAEKKKMEKEKAEAELKLKNANAMIQANSQQADTYKEEAMMATGGPVKPVGKNKSYPPGVNIPLSDKEGWTESQWKERNERLKSQKILGRNTLSFTTKGNADIEMKESTTKLKIDEKTGLAGYVHGGLVQGKGGIDKVKANLPTGSFVVPVENANHPVVSKASKMLQYGIADKTKGTNPVMLTKGEVVIEKKDVAMVDKLAKANGMLGIGSLAPNAKAGNKFVGGTKKEGVQPVPMAEPQVNMDDNTNMFTPKKIASDVYLNPDLTAPEDINTTITPEMTKKYKKDQKAKNPVDIGTHLGVVQGAMGLAGLMSSGNNPNDNMPEYNIDPNIQKDIALLASKRNKGIDDSVRNSIDRTIENERQTNVVLAKEFSGGSNVTAFNRAILANSNANEKRIAVASMDQEQKNKNLAASIEGNKLLAGMNRTIYEDKMKKKQLDQDQWEKKQNAWAEVVGAGIKNVIGSQQLKKNDDSLDRIRKILA